MILSDFWVVQQYFRRHRASRGLFATAELLVKTTVINCYFPSGSASLNFCTKRRYLFIKRALKQLSLLSPVHTGDKVEFNTVDFVESRQSRPCRFGPVDTGNKVDCIGNKVERRQSWTVDFVADLLPVLATVDFQQSRPCWIQLCRQCVPSFSWQNNRVKNFTWWRLYDWKKLRKSHLRLRLGLTIYRS